MSTKTLEQKLADAYGGPLPPRWFEYLANVVLVGRDDGVYLDICRSRDSANREAEASAERAREMREYVRHQEAAKAAVDASITSPPFPATTGEQMGRWLIERAGLDVLLPKAMAELAKAEAAEQAAKRRANALYHLAALADSRRNRMSPTARTVEALGCEMAELLSPDQLAAWERGQKEAEERKRSEERARVIATEAEQVRRERERAEIAHDLERVNALDRYQLICRAFPDENQRAAVAMLFSMTSDYPEGRAALNEFYRVLSLYEAGPVLTRIAERLREFDAARAQGRGPLSVAA